MTQKDLCKKKKEILYLGPLVHINHINGESRLGSVSRSCIDQIQYVGTVSCFHLFDVMVAYGSLIDKRVYIRGAGALTQTRRGGQAELKVTVQKPQLQLDACIKSLSAHCHFLYMPSYNGPRAVKVSLFVPNSHGLVHAAVHSVHSM